MPLVPSPGVVKALEILQQLASDPTHPASVSEISRQVGIPRATADTLLLALATRGFVRRDSALRYSLGASAVAVGDAARSADPVLSAAAARAATLARTLRANTAVSVRAGHETRVVSVFDHGPGLGLRIRAGAAVSLVAPFGATFVAWAGEQEVSDWLDGARPRLSEGQRTRFREELDHIRSCGYSLTVVTDQRSDLLDALDRTVTEGSDEARRERHRAESAHTHDGYLTSGADPRRPVRLAQLSAPVFGPDGEVYANLMLLGPGHELPGAEVRELADQLVAAARAASREAAPHLAL